MSHIKGQSPAEKMADPEIIMVKAIVSVLATSMLYTGRAYPLVNEANIRCTLHYTATCVIVCPYRDTMAWCFYHRNEGVVPMVFG